MIYYVHVIAIGFGIYKVVMTQFNMSLRLPAKPSDHHEAVHPAVSKPSDHVSKPSDHVSKPLTASKTTKPAHMAAMFEPLNYYGNVSHTAATIQEVDKFGRPIVDYNDKVTWRHPHWLNHYRHPLHPTYLTYFDHSRQKYNQAMMMAEFPYNYY